MKHTKGGQEAVGVESAVLEGAVGLRDQSLEGGAGDEMGCGLGWI